MAFNVGDLIARLRADTTQFDAGMAKAQAGIKAVETAAVKADRQVGVSQRSIRAYTQAQRLSADEIRAAAAAYDGNTRASIYNTRAIVLQHMKALEMNTAFDAGAQATQRGTLNMGQFSNALRSAAVQMSGMNPIAGRLLGTIGQFAAGTGVMLGVFAGIAGLSTLIRYLTSDSREAKEALEGARNAARELAEAKLPGSIRTQNDVAGPLRNERDRLQRELDSIRGQIEIARQDAPRNIDSQREVERLEAREVRLRRELAAVTVDLARTEAAAAEQAEEEVEAREKQAESLAGTTAEINRQIDAWNRLLPAQRQAMNESLMPLLGPGRAGRLAGNDRAAFYRGPGGRVVAVGPGGVENDIAQTYRRMRDNMYAFSGELPKARSRLEQFGDAVERAFQGAIDTGALGANLAGQGIGMALGLLGDALFGPKYVNAIEENTRALRRLSGDTSELEQALQYAGPGMNALRDMLRDQIAQGQLSGALDLARRRAAALDMGAAGEFAALQQVLKSSIGGNLGDRLGALTPETVGDFLAQVLEQITTGQFNASQLGRIPLADFLDILAEMESLGDAAGDAAGELGSLASTLRNAPAGFKANFLRYQADSGVNMQTPYEVLPPIHISGDITIVADDPVEFGNEMRRQARRGGTTTLQLATRPTGSFVRGSL